MFASAGMMLASTALGRIDQVMCAPTLKKPPRPQKPQDSRVEFADVSFTYDGAASPPSPISPSPWSRGRRWPW